jgi:membrane associated rhomboid family serine protease
VSVVLVHDPTDPLHLAFNMYALWLVGPIVEELFGHARYLLLYVLLAAAASTLSYVILPQDAVGASGAIFGLFGMLFVTMRVYHPVLDRRARALVGQIGFLIVLNLLLGFGLMGAGVGIDNFAHIGGLLAGCWLALAIPPRAATTLAGAFQRPGTTASRTLVPVLFQAAAVVALVAVIAAGVAYGTAERESGTMPVSNASHTVVMRAPD